MTYMTDADVVEYAWVAVRGIEFRIRYCFGDSKSDFEDIWTKCGQCKRNCKFPEEWCQHCYGHSGDLARAVDYIAGQLDLPIEADDRGERWASNPLIEHRYWQAYYLLRDIFRFDTTHHRRMHDEAKRHFEPETCEKLVRPPRKLNFSVALGHATNVAEFVRSAGRLPNYKGDASEASLAKFLEKQRAGLWRTTVVHERLDDLVPGWRGGAHIGGWERNLAEVAAFRSQYERLPSRKSTDLHERQLGSWIHNQKQRQRSAAQPWAAEKLMRFHDAIRL